MILDKIVADVSIELEERKRRLPLAEIVKLALAQSPPLNLTSALHGNDVRLIAEVKKASPSKGVICQNFNPVAIARIYANNGAAAISVLTEPKYFQGNLNYLMDIKQILADKTIPLLRKDFIFDPYPVYEARAYGADSILLIVAILTSEKLSELLQLSHQLGMMCLVEVHNEAELGIALKSRAEIIGINNRDLNTFAVDLNTTMRLRSLIPSNRIVVSESGIKSRKDIEKLREWGVNAALIGEALMSAPDIAAKMRETLMTWVKICGISDIESAIAASQAGTDYLGMVFAPSRRQISPEKALKIIESVRQLDLHPQVVGVFVNKPASEVNQIADYCKLDWVQLSGDESWEYCTKIETPIIKVLHIAPDARQAEISADVWKGYSLIPPNQLICLLDSIVEGSYGGTGTTFNWQVAKDVSEKFSVMIAGGLTPDNVGHLIKLTNPWAVDVSSGVETNGKKDATKMKAFIETVHRLDLERGGGGHRD